MMREEVDTRDKVQRSSRIVESAVHRGRRIMRCEWSVDVTEQRRGRNRSV